MNLFGFSLQVFIYFYVSGPEVLWAMIFISYVIAQTIFQIRSSRCICDMCRDAIPENCLTIIINCFQGESEWIAGLNVTTIIEQHLYITDCLPRPWFRHLSELIKFHHQFNRSIWVLYTCCCRW